MIEAIVTDIEGTTTSLSFVHDVLFPYARERIEAFVRARAGDPAVAEALRGVAAEEGRELSLDEAIATLVRWIDEDRKVTPLKALQGLLWTDGYREGDYVGHVYDDAVRWLRRWHEDGVRLYVYSSGSVRAQKLLFAHTGAGDLTPLFSGYFDTTTGGKKEAASYRAIAAEIGRPPERIAFLSDVVAELDAAREAGMVTVHLVRDGDLGERAAHPPARDFDGAASLLPSS